jgi:hypothetical protein
LFADSSAKPQVTAIRVGALDDPYVIAYSEREAKKARGSSKAC